MIECELHFAYKHLDFCFKRNEPELVIRQKNMKTKNLNSGAMFVSKGHTAMGCADLRGLNCHLGQW